MEIVRGELTSDVLYPPTLRYNPTLEIVEYTNDGGTTWTPAPGQDPRLVALVPPPDTANPACDGAERITEHYQELVAVAISGISGGTIAVVARILSLLFPPFALLILVITLVAEGLIALGAEAIAEAFLGSEWDDFKCIVFDHIGADGFVTEAGLALIRSDVNSLIGGTAATVLNLLMDVTGFGGMNDAAGQRTETGDCDTCVTWAKYWDAEHAGDLILTYGTVDGTSWKADSVGADHVVIVTMPEADRTLPATTELLDSNVTWHMTAAFVNVQVNVSPTLAICTFACSNPYGTPLSVTGYVNPYFDWRLYATTNEAWIDRIVIAGRGECPWPSQPDA